ncbi:hypothetical protein DOM22_05325 [Bdellovibrio sp. ZAP7]|uniref:hypothetical protein n=1 Tax=Bdellovibrio sp. ZAP7 TaxID=2231053 RepID=UPI0011590AB7|nr:hypothetical protein [Bdellovibrio sp. ZAP7]QDK44622.1 hypothetical protein DOM22_05325 [Bdellovibrio sp. ZAP7]
MNLHKIVLLILCLLSFEAYADGGVKSSKMYSDLLIGHPFAEASTKFGKFENNENYVCRNPPNCGYSYMRKERSACVQTIRSVFANGKTGLIEEHNVSMAGQCNMYGDLPKVSEILGKDFPVPKFVQLNSDRSGLALWFDGDIAIQVFAFCGEGTDYGPRGPTVKKFIDCRVSNYVVLKKAEKDYADRFKKNNFKFQ